MPKTDARIEALGAIDELNSLLGVCKTKAKKGIAVILEEIQQNLFIMQAELGGAKKEITKEKVDTLEKIVDAVEKKLPPPRNFVLAGGSELSALLDYARAIARSTERRVIGARMRTSLSPHTLAYLNRLSSALFALARLANARVGRHETNPHY